MMTRTFELHPRLEQDSAYVMDLPLCQLRLINDSQYPWLLLIPRVSNIREIIELGEAQQRQLWQESAKVSRVLQQLFSPDKLNVAALGNMVPQLHLHHIARFSTDASWPNAVWGQVPAIAYEPQAQVQLISKIQQQMESMS